MFQKLYGLKGDKDNATGLTLENCLKITYKDHHQFLKWNPIYFIAHSCKLSRELSKSL